MLLSVDFCQPLPSGRRHIPEELVFLWPLRQRHATVRLCRVDPRSQSQTIGFCYDSALELVASVGDSPWSLGALFLVGIETGDRKQGTGNTQTDPTPARASSHPGAGRHCREQRTRDGKKLKRNVIMNDSIERRVLFALILINDLSQQWPAPNQQPRAPSTVPSRSMERENFHRSRLIANCCEPRPANEGARYSPRRAGRHPSRMYPSDPCSKRTVHFAGATTIGQREMRCWVQWPTVSF